LEKVYLLALRNNLAPVVCTSTVNLECAQIVKCTRARTKALSLTFPVLSKCVTSKISKI